jgi:hypothetical protein
MRHRFTSILSASAFVIAAFIFGACEQSSVTEFKIENNSESVIKVTCYNLTGSATNYETKTVETTLGIGESFRLDHYERLTSYSHPYRKNVIEFFDSVNVEHVERQIIAPKTFKSIGDWPFNEDDGTHLLTIDEDDF